MTTNWVTCKIEEVTKAALIHELGGEAGDAKFGSYAVARRKLLENILEQIVAIQPKLTDHGPRHIRNVLDNASELLGDKLGTLDDSGYQKGELTSLELYILIFSILFHDVGNFFSREDHRKEITQIYAFARPQEVGNEAAEEKKIILGICEAHCGESLDGSNDTLKDVEIRSKLERLPIRPYILAPILRFADELAEGEQRTSHFMLKLHEYPEVNQIYHQYAAATHVDINRQGGSIRLTYHLTLTRSEGDEVATPQGAVISMEQLEEFLEFIYRRIEKLDQERQYAKFYCSLLDPFVRTTATFNFWYMGFQIPHTLQSLDLSDLVVPGDPQKSIAERNAQYEPASVAALMTNGMELIDNNVDGNNE